jgi:hypothetical protein
VSTRCQSPGIATSREGHCGRSLEAAGRNHVVLRSCVSSESRVIVANSAAGSRSVSQSAASCSRRTTCVRQCGSWAAGDRGGCQPPAALLCRLADALVGDDSVDFGEEGRNEAGAALDANLPWAGWNWRDPGKGTTGPAPAPVGCCLYSARVAVGGESSVEFYPLFSSG